MFLKWWNTIRLEIRFAKICSIRNLGPPTRLCLPCINVYVLNNWRTIIQLRKKNFFYKNILGWRERYWKTIFFVQNFYFFIIHKFYPQAKQNKNNNFFRSTLMYIYLGFSSSISHSVGVYENLQHEWVDEEDAKSLHMAVDMMGLHEASSPNNKGV